MTSKLLCIIHSIPALNADFPWHAIKNSSDELCENLWRLHKVQFFWENDHVFPNKIDGPTTPRYIMTHFLAVGGSVFVVPKCTLIDKDLFIESCHQMSQCD
ncbi:hypothetical protein CDAR_382281 [Caerostris darwini]|uniref:Uncharacterized protein n=1 Tax=Caerostris darwini TaxID=1538125 RepID=A0AAV4VZI8_9ARAC|nr:hypothetical protein CDAR_382281 [Caerostris darwini]